MRNSPLRVRAALLSAAAFAMMAASNAHAGFTGNPLVVTALASDGSTSSWAMPTSWGTWNGNDWSYDGTGRTYEMHAGNDPGAPLLGTLTNLHMVILDDPQVTLNFTAQAGASTTKFIFTSALVSVGLNNPTASASAGITVTDSFFADGALMSGMHGDGRAYWANYNGSVPGGTNYASFLPIVSATAVQVTNSGSDSAGPTALPGFVSDMSSQFSFSLSAFDSASGSSNYQIVPTPAGLALLGLGAACSRRRRN